MINADKKSPGFCRGFVLIITTGTTGAAVRNVVPFLFGCAAERDGAQGCVLPPRHMLRPMPLDGDQRNSHCQYNQT